jgi:hypothetical protein
VGSPCGAIPTEVSFEAIAKIDSLSSPSPFKRMLDIFGGTPVTRLQEKSSKALRWFQSVIKIGSFDTS